MEWMSSLNCKHLKDFLETVIHEQNFKGRELQADEIAPWNAQSCETIARLGPCKYSSKGPNGSVV